MTRSRRITYAPSVHRRSFWAGWREGRTNLRKLFQRRNPARELALLGVEKRRRDVLEVMQQIRAELGLPPVDLGR